MENNSFSGKQGNKVLENQFPLFFEPDSKICGKKILHEGKKKSFFFSVSSSPNIIMRYFKDSIFAFWGNGMAS